MTFDPQLVQLYIVLSALCGAAIVYARYFDMTSSTSTILIEREDGERDEISGVMYAEETTHPETGIRGVAVQYAIGDEREAEVEFFEAKMWGVYDDLADDRVAEKYLNLVNNE